MTHEHQGPGVELPKGLTGSSYLYELLARAVQRFPEALSGAALPSDSNAFKQSYAEALVRFEAARAASPQRAEIARSLCLDAERALRFVDGARESDFSEQLKASNARPLTLVRGERQGHGRLSASVSFEGKLYSDAQLIELAQLLYRRHAMTTRALEGLTWIVEKLAYSPEGLSLEGERFVLLGAAAELAPVDLLLAAGAEVLWIDVREPSADLLLERRNAGVLHYPRGGADLLAQPHTIASTVESFAADGPVHVWMYAYAAGASQEWRLTASMNAITRRLPASAVKSIATLISPTTPLVVSSEDAALADERKARASAWKRALKRAGQLSEGQLARDNLRVSYSIVPTQGVSYQAAQYVGKILAAESYAVYGSTLGESESPLTVSANVAPITATRSLSHPVFEAAFMGASMFDILISKPTLTRTLSGLLSLHDVLNPAAPGAKAQSYASASDRARALFTEQIHGGVYAQPYALDGCIAVAAVKGLAKRPKLALGLLR